MYPSSFDRDRMHLAISEIVAEGAVHHKRRRLYGVDYLVLYDPAQVPLQPPLALEDYVTIPHVLGSLRGDAPELVRCPGATRLAALGGGGHATLRSRTVRSEGGSPALDRAEARSRCSPSSVWRRAQCQWCCRGGRCLDALARLVQPQFGAPVVTRDRRPSGRCVMRCKAGDGQAGALRSAPGLRPRFPRPPIIAHLAAGFPAPVHDPYPAWLRLVCV